MGRNRRKGEDQVGLEGFRYITGKRPAEGLDEHLRREQQARIAARADPRGAGELEIEALSPPPPEAEADEGTAPIWGPHVNDPDVDTQGRAADETRDWWGDAWSDTGEPRLDEGED